MLRLSFRIAVTLFLLTASGLGIWQYRRFTVEQRQIADLQQQKIELQKKTEQLQGVVSRLTAEKRVAEILVTSRRRDETGSIVSDLLFVEYARDGSTLPPRNFSVRGDHVHVDALVIEFQSDLVQKDDPLRGHSILLFDKIYGSSQQPDSAERIDSPGTIPALYAGANPNTRAFEQQLWNRFWELAADESLRKESGVKLANGKGIYGPFAPDRLYTITLDAAGKLSIVDAPLKGAVGEAMRRMSTTRNSLN